MFNTSDNWLQQNLNMPQGTTAKGLMGVGQYLYNNYRTDQLARQAKGLEPMSFEDYKNSYFSPDQYRAAANKMAIGGHTGTLPALLARMNQSAGQGYATYKQNVGQQNLNNQAYLQSLRQKNLANLFTPFGHEYGMATALQGT